MPPLTFLKSKFFFPHHILGTDDRKIRFVHAVFIFKTEARERLRDIFADVYCTSLKVKKKLPPLRNKENSEILCHVHMYCKFPNVLRN